MERVAARWVFAALWCYFSRARSRATLTCALAVVALLLLIDSAEAQIGSARYSSIVVDAATGSVISAINADDSRYPASLTKMMTLYLTFEALRDRRVTLDTEVPVSLHAASQFPSKLGLLPGTRLTVEQAVLALVTKSANDAAAALGELLGGDEERFAQIMTLRARALGMEHTVFRNASGLPDLEQITTARDLATLARHLVQDFPGEYHYFSVPRFVFHGRVIPNHDHLLQTYPGADGIKTGYIVASGFNLVTSAVRGETRLIGVVIGAARAGERDQHMAALLDAGFESRGIPIAPAGDGRSVASRIGLVASAQAATIATAAPPAVHASIRRLTPAAPSPKHRASIATSATPQGHAPQSTATKPAPLGRAAATKRRADGHGTQHSTEG